MGTPSDGGLVEAVVPTVASAAFPATRAGMIASAPTPWVDPRTFEAEDAALPDTLTCEFCEPVQVSPPG